MKFPIPLYAPLDKSGDFTFEGVQFHWLYHNKWSGSRLSFRYGAAKVAITMLSDIGLLNSHDKIAVWVDDMSFGSFADSVKITDTKLRGAVELGLRAWTAQAQINLAAAKEARARALKRL
jgi:hypothetical protein